MSALDLIKAPGADDATSIILKLVGESCNLDCSYCYEKRKPYAGSRILDPAVVEQVLSRLAPKRLAIELHGGEPLLYPKTKFEQLSEVLNSYAGRLDRVTMQTNGTLLNSESCTNLLNWFPSLQLGVSCDGPPSLNRERVFYSGTSSAASVESTLRLIEQAGINIGIICVVSRGNVDSPIRLLEYFSEFKSVKSVKFVPCFDEAVTQAAGPRRRVDVLSVFNNVEGAPPWSLRPEEYSRFLSDAFDAWIEKGIFQQFVVEPFVTMIRKIRGAPTNNCHFEHNKCAHVFTIYPDQTIGSCDELERIEAQYGLASESSSFQGPATSFHAGADPIIANLGRACTVCSHQRTCGGGCIATRKRMAKNGSDHLYCAHRRATLDHVESRLANWEQR